MIAPQRLTVFALCASSLVLLDATAQVTRADYERALSLREKYEAARSGEYSRYGQRKQFDFFVQHLQGIKPPDWNVSSGKATTTSQQ
jgi:hypothetical protein